MSPSAHGATVRTLPMGESAVLLQPTDARTVLDLYRRLEASRPPGVTDLVPAAETVLVSFDRRVIARVTVDAWVLAVTGSTGSATRATAEPTGDAFVEVPVRYDGDDLAVVAELAGASVEDVIAAHLDQLWTAAFIGFAPGFAYLTGENDRLAVPRRPSPRAVVPAGSVAVAAGYCGIYPRPSPGGWHLIGHTDAVLWEPARPQPALLAPGTRVRFVRE